MGNNITFWVFVAGGLMLVVLLASRAGQQDGVPTTYYPAPEPGDDE